MIEFGLWQTVMSYTSQKDKIAALQSQIRFRQHVLQQLPPVDEKDIYVVSIKGKTHSVDELTRKVKKLVDQANALNSPSPQPNYLVHHRIKHKFNSQASTSKDKWYKARLSARCVV
jgi:hypothetical protein